MSATEFQFVEPFTAHDADAVILCPSPTSTGPIRVYQLKKADLAASSRFYRDMFDAPHAHPDERWHGLEVVPMRETASVIEIILGAACNLPSASSWGAIFETWQDVLTVWEAAHFYQMCMLQALAQARILATLPAIPVNDALRIQIRARVLGDSSLAEAALQRIKLVHYIELDVSLMKEMRSSDLHALLEGYIISTASASLARFRNLKASFRELRSHYIMMHPDAPNDLQDEMVGRLMRMQDILNQEIASRTHEPTPGS